MMSLQGYLNIFDLIITTFYTLMRGNADYVADFNGYNALMRGNVGDI